MRFKLRAPCVRASALDLWTALLAPSLSGGFGIELWHRSHLVQLTPYPHLTHTSRPPALVCPLRALCTHAGTLEYSELNTLLGRSVLPTGATPPPTPSPSPPVPKPKKQRSAWVNPNSFSLPIAQPPEDKPKHDLVILSTKHAEEWALGLVHSSSAHAFQNHLNSAPRTAGGNSRSGSLLGSSSRSMGKSISLSSLSLSPPRGLPQGKLQPVHRAAGGAATRGEGERSRLHTAVSVRAPPSRAPPSRERVGALVDGEACLAGAIPMIPEPETSISVPPFLMTGGDFEKGEPESQRRFNVTQRMRPKQRVVLPPPPMQPIDLKWPETQHPPALIHPQGGRRPRHEVQVLVIPSRGASRESRRSPSRDSSRSRDAHGGGGMMLRGQGGLCSGPRDSGRDSRSLSRSVGSLSGFDPHLAPWGPSYDRARTHLPLPLRKRPVPSTAPPPPEQLGMQRSATNKTLHSDSEWFHSWAGDRGMDRGLGATRVRSSDAHAGV